MLDSHTIEELIGQFYRYSRPIADAFQEPRPDMQLGSAALFFETVHAFTVHGPEHLEPSLLMLLDEFSRLDQHSYNELYLWCIVLLSRIDRQHTAAFWPLVFDLDLRYRAASWRRPLGASPADQPYRLTELVFYFYVINTRQRRAEDRQRLYPSLGRCLLHLEGHLTAEQRELTLDTLNQLAQETNQLAQETRSPEFGDALGLLLRKTQNGDATPGDRHP